MKRVLVVSASAITQAGLATLIVESSDRWQVVVASALGSELWATAPEADCALITGPTLGENLTTLPLALPAVALLDTWSDGPLASLLQAGFVGLLPTQARGTEIVAALEAALAGLVTIHPALLEDLLPFSPVHHSLEDWPPSPALTPREVEVLTLLAEGLSNKAIAQRLHLSEHTVKYHTSAIFAKLEVSTRTEAAIAGARAGLIVL